MARKKANERRAEVLAALEAAKRDVAELEAKDAARIGKLAVRAGLADLDLEEATLLKEFQALAGRFRGNGTQPPGAQTRKPAADGADAGASADGRP